MQPSLFFFPLEEFQENHSIYVPGMKYTLTAEDVDLAECVTRWEALRMVRTEEP